MKFAELHSRGPRDVRGQFVVYDVVSRRKWWLGNLVLMPLVVGAISFGGQSISRASILILACFNVFMALKWGRARRSAVLRADGEHVCFQVRGDRHPLVTLFFGDPLRDIRVLVLEIAEVQKVGGVVFEILGPPPNQKELLPMLTIAVRPSCLEQLWRMLAVLKDRRKQRALGQHLLNWDQHGMLFLRWGESYQPKLSEALVDLAASVPNVGSIESRIIDLRDLHKRPTVELDELLRQLALIGRHQICASLLIKERGMPPKEAISYVLRLFQHSR